MCVCVPNSKHSRVLQIMKQAEEQLTTIKGSLFIITSSELFQLKMENLGIKNLKTIQKLSLSKLEHA